MLTLLAPRSIALLEIAVNRGGRPPFDAQRPPRPKREKGSTRSKIRDPLVKSDGAAADSRAPAGRKPARPRPGQDQQVAADQSRGGPAPQQPRQAQPRQQAGGASPSQDPRQRALPAKAAATPAAPVAPAPAPQHPHEPDYHATSWSDEDLHDQAPGPAGFRCGAVTLAGQPNAGKSTLTNRLLGEKLSIVSPRPQTTRDNLRGILTTPRSQIALIDTPGIHKARSQLNRAMVGQAVEALESVDVVVLVIDAVKAARWAAEVDRERAQQAAAGEGSAKTGLAASPEAEEDSDDAEDADALTASADGQVAEKKAKPKRIALDEHLHPGDRRVIRQILEHTTKWMVALNKIDVVKPRHLLPVMKALNSAPQIGPVVPVSAWTADGLRHLIAAIEGFLPLGEMAFAPDELTDRPLRYLVAELVREQVFLQIREEVPYGVACETEVYEELEDLSHIQVVVHVERPAQRAILVGKAGSRMKQIATAARLQMEQLCGRKVFLEVHVRIEPSWSERLDKLREFGYLVD